jgi:hypothetical protein
MLRQNKHLPSPHDPFRDPAWRYRRAAYLVEHGRSPLPQDDALTSDAWRFLRELADCEDEVSRGLLAQRFSGIAEAHQFFLGAPPLRRAELEARLLANQADEIIAEKLDLSVGSVRMYHDLYYSVRASLEASDYISNVVLRGEVTDGARAEDREWLLRVFGYSRGGVAVDSLLTYFESPPEVPISLAQLSLQELRQLRDKLHLKALVLALTTPAGATTPQAWVEIAERFATTSQGGEEEAVRAAISVVARLEEIARAPLTAVPA